MIALLFQGGTRKKHITKKHRINQPIMTRLLIPLCLYCALPAWGNPFGVFHFNLPGQTPAERIEFLTDIGYD